jgi:exodeoxyribonuclease VII large subunit
VFDDRSLEALNNLSPLNTMKRGYSIATDNDGAVIKTINDVQKNQKIIVKLHDGNINCTTNSTENN